MDTCETCGGRGWVWVEEDADSPCPDCLMDAAVDERFALPAWEARREAEREAMPVPSGLDSVPW